MKGWINLKINIDNSNLVRFAVVAGLLVVMAILIVMANPAQWNHNHKNKMDNSVVLSTGTIVSGDTILARLTALGLTPTERSKITRSLSSIFSFRRVRPGDTFELRRSTDGVVLSFDYYSYPDKVYSVVRSSSSEGIMVASQHEVPLEKEMVGFRGTIKHSLYETVVDGGQSGEIAMKIADILAWQVDFLTEPRPGDEVRVVWERYRRNGEFLFDGRILAVEYRGKIGRHFAVYYDGNKEGNKEGNKKYAGYYDLDGRSVRKAFLRAPLLYRRISSYFSHRRFHPILRYWRPHLGIDYAAPTGTPVEAVGDGKVIFVGRNHDYGNQVKIRHNSTYITYYGHLSRFARGIRKGKYVKQGQVIGYVGATGLATGPHLDFRIKRYGKFVNFLKLKIPPAKSLPKRLREEYKSLRIERLAALGSLWKCGESVVLTKPSISRHGG